MHKSEGGSPLNTNIINLMYSQLIFAAWGLIAREVPINGMLLVMIMGISGAIFCWVVLPRSAFPIPKGSIIVGINLTLDTLLLIYAYRHLPLATVITIHFLGPLIVQFAAPLLLREHPTKSQYLLAVFGFIGAYFVAQPKFSYSELTGILAAFASAFTLAGNIIFQKLRMNKAAEPAIAVVQYNIVLALCSCTIFIVGYLLYPDYVQSINVYLILLAAIAGLLVQGLAMLIFNRAIQKVPGSVAAIVSTIEVVFAAILGAIIYKENLTIIQMAGMLSVLFSISIINAQKGQHDE